MDGRITIQYLQAYIKAKDHHPEREKDYLLKLVEETGELARAMRKERIPASPDQIKGTIEEEIIMLWQSRIVMILMLKRGFRSRRN